MTKFWGARFEGKTDSLADKFSFSISYDYRLAKYDCIAGIAHATMLGKQKIIPQSDANKIVSGLKKLLKQIEASTFKYDPKAEDIHTNVQASLKKLIGAPADKLHTARSRNDLIVCDMKLYCIEEAETIVKEITKLQKALVKCAAKYQDVIIPAYTHLQAAQVVTAAHHLLAYVEMLERDKGRLFGAIKRMNTNPLGSCALSGTSLPTNRNMVTKLLKFAETSMNSIDAVSDRDFIMETLSDIAICGVHCSRIAEDMILWATSEFDFIHMDSSLCTGSSIMPHKKNPDMCELIRGEAGTLISNLNQVLILLKGTALTYNRDFQLDKPPLFESVEKMHDILGLLEKLFATLKIDKAVVAKRVDDEYFFTVDVMDYLIKKGVSYRDAHNIVGKMTKQCLDNKKKISDLTEAQLKKFHPKFAKDVKKVLNAKTSVSIKKSLGSTNPSLVRQQISRWKKKL